MHANSVARLYRHLTITILAMFFVSACGEGDGQPSIAGTPAPALSGVLVDAPVSGVSWETTASGLSGSTDAQGTFQYQSYDSVTFSIGGIVLGTVPGAPVISPVELTGSSNPTDQPALNMLVFLQSIDADSDPSNGIAISAEAQTNASGINVDFHSVDFATQIAAVVSIIAPGNTVVDETDALNHFYNTYAEFGGTDTFAWDFPGYPPVGGGASFELVFADEFNEGTAPDPAKWNYETGYGPGDTGWGNNEWQLYTDSPDNVRVEDGNLVISALCDAPCGVRDGSVTSGKINTLGKFNFKFGKIQARIKPPVGKAAWPAFWSLGTNFPEIGWPRSGEIDFMEVHTAQSWTNENTTHFTVHWDDNGWIFDSQSLDTGESLGDDFHIFEADWNEDRIIGKIDGVEYFRADIDPETMEEFLEEFYLILNVAMGGTLGSDNQPPAGDETFPQTMLVDYVRVFQGTDGGGGGGAGGVLANFDDVIPDTITEFGGAAPAVEAGPMGGDGNALKITRDGGDVFAGVFISVSGIPTDPVEQTISALVYSPKAGIPFVTKLEYEENVGTGDVQANETVVAGWQTLTWTYSLEAGNDYNRFVILPDLGTVGAGEAYYIDNITLVSGNGDDGDDGDDGGPGGGDAPTVAAATPPARDAGDVVSLFSDAYTDVTVDTWKTDWSIAVLADVEIEGNATKEYTNLNFVGVETVAEQIDATGMTHFHVDVWTPNAETLEIKLVDFGPNGAFEGNLVEDDTEGSIFYDGDSLPVPAQGEWLSLDIPLADFEAAGLVNRANIAQLIFAADPRGDATLYVDNVYFYNDAGDDGTGGGDAPTVAAPTPTQDAGNVISLYSDGYTDGSVTWPTEWSAVDSVSDVTIEGGLVKEHLGVGFVGIEFPSLDVSGMTHFHMDVYTPDADSLLVKLVDFGGDGFGGDNDTEGPLTFDGTTTPALTQGEWISLDIPLADMQAAGLANLTDINQLIFDAEPDGTIVYVDNVYFYNDAGGGDDAPTTAAPTPTVDVGSVTSVFSDAYTDPVGVNYDPDWGQATDTTVESIAGGEVLKLAGLNYQGIDFVTGGTALNVSAHDTLHIDFWTPDATAVNVYLISSGPAETPYALPIVAGSWQSVDIPLSAFSGVVNLADVIQMKFDDATTEEAATIFFDNIYFYTAGDAGGDAPTVAAPTPTQDAGNVISLFSDSYTDEAVTWPTEWSGVDSVSDVTIEGGLVKEHLGVGFVGIEFASLDVSGMTHFHMDVWTPDADSLLVKLVDFGGDGFGGDNDTEGPLTFDATTTPALTQGAWIGLDIPLADMQAAGLANLTDINQLIFDAEPDGTIVYVDNVYFYNDAGGGTGGGTAPTAAAPTPTQDAGNVISLFSDGYTDEAVTWPTEWSAVDSVSDVTIEGGLVKEHLGVGFVGIEFASLDVSGMTHFHMDVWTPDADSLLVKLVDFGGDGFGGDNDTEGPLTFDATTTPALTQGTWVSLDIPLSDMQAAGLAGLTDLNQLIFDAEPDGTIVYVDNVYFYNDAGGDTGGGGTALVDFETAGTGAGFTWAVFENDDNPPLEIVANPDASGINGSATVGKITARVTGNPWAGTESAHGDVGPITLDASNSIVKVMVYKSVVSDVGIKFAIASGGAQTEIKVPNTLINQWEELTFDLSGYIGLPEAINIDQVIFFPDFDLAGRTQDNVVYFDNIRLTDGS